jgi:hypothetical protein
MRLELQSTLPRLFPLKRARTFLADFQAFINHGNVVDLAVAVFIGGAFGKVVDAVVSLADGFAAAASPQGRQCRCHRQLAWLRCACVADQFPGDCVCCVSDRALYRSPAAQGRITFAFHPGAVELSSDPPG